MITFLILTACENTYKNAEGASADEKPATTCSKLEGLDVLVYTVPAEEDSIQYIKIGTDTTSVKPVLLFLQGSLPVPLIIDFEDFKHVGIPFQYSELIDDFHLAVISMPHTPVTARRNELDGQYCFVTDTALPHSYSRDYLKGNYLENYVARARSVIRDIGGQPWATNSEIHLAGHSQGAKVAAVTASENRDIATVSLLGFNAFGRFDERIRRERAALRLNRISGSEYLDNIQAHYERWEEINRDPDNFENGNLNWTSFSIDYTPYLLRIDRPLFVAYGTEDLSAENCDLLPLIFIENQKSNLTLKPYPGLDHNFFELIDGTPAYKTGGHWTNVIHDLAEWINTPPND